MKIIIGSDHGGYNLKNKIIEHLTDKGVTHDDVGCFSIDSCDYPIIADVLTKKVLENDNNLLKNEKLRGILEIKSKERATCFSYDACLNEYKKLIHNI